jgi:hypothetical protein
VPIPVAHPQTLLLNSELDALGLRAQTITDALMATDTGEELLKRWPSIQASMLQMRGVTVNASTQVTRGYLATYGIRLPADYQAGLGGFNWKREMAKVTSRARRRIAEGMSPDEVAAMLRREWRGRALGEPFRASRHTVAQNVTRYVRVPEASACEFCMMLATRSGQYSYRSRDSAGEGLQYHNRCRCSVQPEGLTDRVSVFR